MRLIVALSLVTLAFAIPTSHGSDNSLVKRGVALAQDVTNTVFNAISKRGIDKTAERAKNSDSEEEGAEEDLNKRFFLAHHFAHKKHHFKHGRSGEEEQEQEPEQQSESPQPGQTQGRGVDGVALGADITNGVFDSLQRNGVSGDGYSDDSGVYETPESGSSGGDQEGSGQEGAPKGDKPPKKEAAASAGRSNEGSDGQSGAATGNEIADNSMQSVRDSGVAGGPGSPGDAGIAIGQMYTNAALGSS
ncbi:hypothetical protein MP638_003494 [Amoeboaphelidium occidentale]|nr:hypothetical protein MP638_003494 [Amoeboaphelidium occidentale]